MEGHNKRIFNFDKRERGYNPEGMLVESHMIPPVEMEVVMTGDGHVEQQFGPSSPQYQYDFAYDDQDMSHFDHAKYPVTLHSDRQRSDWKSDQKLKMDLYEVLDAIPSHLHDKFVDSFAKRGINLEAKRQQPSGSHYLIPQRTYERRRQQHLQQQYYNEQKNYGKPKQYMYSHDLDLSDDMITNDAVDDQQPVYQVEYKSPNDKANRLCTGCNLLLRRSVFYHHARMIRERGACNLFTPQRFPCPHCDGKLGTLEKLCQHLDQIHGAPTEIKTIQFTSEAEFVEFRTDLEGRGGNFRMARGNKKNKKGIVQYFRCNRLQTLAKNQTFRLVDNPNEEDLPSNKKRGKLNEKISTAKTIIRTETSCTAFYNKAYLDNGMIEVRYCDHHLHEDEKLRLPDAVRRRVIELARKCLPHIVVLMIVKDERFKYCVRNSANDRRILDMKPQDIRQILAGCNRQEKVRMRRGGLPKTRIRIIDNGEGMLIPTEEEEEGDWAEARNSSIQRVNREALTPLEARYLNLFENNRDEMMIRMQDKVKIDNEKRTLFESFIHRTASSQEFFKNLDFSRIVPSEDHYARLDKALEYLQAIQELLANARKEPKIQMQNTFLEMMQAKTREGERRLGIQTGLHGGLMEDDGDVDVVGGVEENPYRSERIDQMFEEEVEGLEQQVLEQEDIEVEEGVDYMMEEEEEQIPMEQEEQQIVEEEIVIGEEEEAVKPTVMVEEEVEEVEQEEASKEVKTKEDQEGGEKPMEEDETLESKKTRTGRVIKPKHKFE